MADAMLGEPDRVPELAAAGVPILVAHGEADDAWLPHVQADMAAAARRPARGDRQLDPLPRGREPAAHDRGAARLLGDHLGAVMNPRTMLAPLPSPEEWTEEEDRLGFFGPDSVTWRIHTDPSYAVGGLRALMLQALHPVAMDGVARNSAGFRDEWWMRMTRTGQYVETLTFGTRTEARPDGRPGARTAPQAVRRRGDDRAALPGRRPRPAALGAQLRGRLAADHGPPGRTGDLRRRRRHLRAGAPGGSPPGGDARGARARGRSPTSTPTSRRIRPSLALTPAASDGVRRLFVPPMTGWVQVLTPARPAWGTFASLGFATLPTWARQMYSMPGFSRTDAAATAALRALRLALLAVPERARWSPIVRA